ncbi:DNA topoisomerase IB [Arundinibacter roseus]|uniref:DNA topoisomerase n=1 Tax=Arundinibacter roseus TaxID=2070510 RepID=A0A4R4KGN4_9BACT|nr:DNA topoisomerase IB [Arundinibacter roseus]TDB66873.1 DNA topoisomerase IB [Arundinibacter roseus]
MTVSIDPVNPVFGALSRSSLRKIRRSPVLTAEAVGLLYVEPGTSAGYFRKKAGKGFYYLDEIGNRCKNKQDLQRFKNLVLPPAWKNVWICKDSMGHLQATGIDEAGRKQYRYHEYWTQIRNYTKYFRLLNFAKALPILREQVDKDLRKKDYSCTKVTALVIRLMEKTCIRIGNQRYRKQHGSSGITTLDARHAQVSGATIRFRFTGKKGIKHDILLRDRSLARQIQHLKSLPGRRLFQYVTDDGFRKNVQAEQVNAYLREHTDGDFSAKDFRTWMGTLTAYEYLATLEPPKNQTDLTRKLNQCFDVVAARLGNTRAVCKRYYVHPAVLSAYTAQKIKGLASANPQDDSIHSVAEQQVMKLLKTQAIV